MIEEIKECQRDAASRCWSARSRSKNPSASPSKLKKTGVKHHVLNAKNHEREAEIVAQAGSFGAVTISTNMAGRGTDIVLGGNPEFMAAAEAGTRDPNDPKFQAALEKYRAQCAGEREQVLKAGGLHILGTERHESRRIDNQLRGRSGRQGDPGSSRFYHFAGRRPAANLRRRPAQGPDGPDRDGRRRADRASMDFARDRKRAEESRVAQLRHPQTSARIRRRDEQASARWFTIAAANCSRRAAIKDDVVEMCEALIEEIVEAHGDDESRRPRNGTGRRSRMRSSSSFKFRPEFP